jgi:hypothetical protein
MVLFRQNGNDAAQDALQKLQYCHFDAGHYYGSRFLIYVAVEPGRILQYSGRINASRIGRKGRVIMGIRRFNIKIQRE